MRVLVASGAAGGAAALAPVVGALTGLGIETDVQARGPALAVFAERGVVARELEDVLTALEPAPAAVCLGLVGPHAGLDHTLARAARLRGIPVVGLIDSWTHVRDRVRTPDGESTAPERVCALDDRMRETLVSSGVPSDRVRVTGHPLVSVLRHWPEDARTRARGALGVGDSERLLAFVSEPAGERPDRPAEEHEIFARVSHALDSRPGWRLAVREHPLRPTLDRVALERVGARTAETLDPIDLLCAADAVVGLSSTLLVWAALLGRPTVSLARRCEVPVPRLANGQWTTWLDAPTRVNTDALRARVGWDREPERRVAECLTELVGGSA